MFCVGCSLNQKLMQNTASHFPSNNHSQSAPCFTWSSSPKSIKVSRNLSTDFKKLCLKPPKTMLGTDFSPKVNMA